MPFNTFTWNNLQPSPSQLISNGQSTLLNNIQFLGYNVGNSTPGYVQLPNGLIFQWGNTVLPVGASGQQAVTFGTAFPNNIYTVYYSVQGASSNNTPQTCINQFTGGGLTPPSVSGFQLRFSGNALGATGSFYWLAIGN